MHLQQLPRVQAPPRAWAARQADSLAYLVPGLTGILGRWWQLTTTYALPGLRLSGRLARLRRRLLQRLPPTFTIGLPNVAASSTGRRRERDNWPRNLCPRPPPRGMSALCGSWAHLRAKGLLAVAYIMGESNSWHCGYACPECRATARSTNAPPLQRTCHVGQVADKRAPPPARRPYVPRRPSRLPRSPGPQPARARPSRPPTEPVVAAFCPLRSKLTVAAHGPSAQQSAANVGFALCGRQQHLRPD